jgi:starvation-inducible DNA-binding protein
MNTAQQLTQIFRDNFVAYFRAHVSHVNIVGRNFASDHKLLQKTYEDLQSQIDGIGEILRTLQEYMPCDISEVLAMSEIDTGELSGDSEFLIDAVMVDLEHLVEEYRELIMIATEDGHEEVANYAQDRVLALEKHIWMHRSTLES